MRPWVPLGCATLAACFIKPTAPGAACAWSAPRQLALDTLAMDEVGPWLSSDRLELVYGVPGGAVSDIRVALRATVDDDFATSAHLDGVQVDTTGGAYRDPSAYGDPYIEDDDQTVWYSGYDGDADLFYAHRAGRGAPFDPAQLADAIIAQGSDEFDPELSADGQELVYADNHAGIDLYMVVRDTAGNFQAPVLLDASSSAADDGPTLSRDGLTMLFASDRDGASRLYEAHRTAEDSATFTPPVLFDGTLDETGDHDPQLSRDGLTVVFSHASGGSTGRDLYEIDRACVP
jgi:hypothetical protein